MNVQSFGFMSSTLPMALTLVVELAFIVFSLAVVWPLHRSAAGLIATSGFIGLIAVCGGAVSTVATSRMIDQAADPVGLLRINAVIVNLGGAVLHAASVALLLAGIVQLAQAFRRERRGPDVAAA